MPHCARGSNERFLLTHVGCSEAHSAHRRYGPMLSTIIEPRRSIPQATELKQHTSGMAASPIARRWQKTTTQEQNQLLVHDPGTPASNRETAVKRDDRTGRDSDKGASAVSTRCTGAACGGGAGGAEVTRDGGAPARQERTRGEEEI